MRSRRPSAPLPAMRWWAVFLGVSIASLYVPSTRAAAEGVEGGPRGRLLRGFQETRGNASFHCSPSGPCLPCQYSEKNDDKYHCSETGYRVPLKCIEIQDNVKEETKKDGRKLWQKQLLTTISNYKWRKLLDDSSKKETGAQSYITYRSCVPIEGQEKLSVLGFEVIILGLLLVSGPVVYLRQKRTVLMSGAGSVRIPTNIPRF